MKFGHWQVDTVVAGSFRLDGGAMFGVVPKNLWSKSAPTDGENRISMAMRLLVARGAGKTVLVDTGAGSGYGEKLEKIYAFDESPSPRELLAPLGVAPESVTDVVITHLHFDHAGGAAAPAAGGWALAYPNARHHVQRSQWEHALDPNPRDRASYFRERIEILEKEGALALHEGGWTLEPGFGVLVFDGHTPGQQLPLVGSGAEAVLFCGDLIPTSAHFPAPYVMAYDLEPVRSMEEKSGVLERAASEGWVLVFEHDPAVAACRVRREDGRIFCGEPVVF